MTGRDGVEGFQAARLNFARRRRRLSQTDLARAINVAPRTIQRYESQHETPREEGLAKLSSALGFPPAFFLDARPLTEIPEGGFSFRAGSKLRARSRDNARAVASLAIDIASWITDEWNLPAPNVPDLREVASGPAAAAALMRDEWNVGHGPISNMVDLLESHGVRVFSLAEDASDVDAFCFWNETTPFVVLNQLKSAERGRFDAAHELAHLALHRSIDFAGKDVEREADAFAAEFLVPKQSLQSQLPSVIDLRTVMKLKTHWRVSAMAMVKRLKDIGRISDWVYRGMCMDLSQQGYRSGEPGGINREVSTILPEVLSTLEADGGGIADIARALNVKAADITPLIFGLSHGARSGLRVIRGGAK